MSELQKQSLDEDSSLLNSPGAITEEEVVDGVDKQFVLGVLSTERIELARGTAAIQRRVQTSLQGLDRIDEGKLYKNTREALEQTLSTVGRIASCGSRLFGVSYAFVDDDQVVEQLHMSDEAIIATAWSARMSELAAMVRRTLPDGLAEVNVSRTPWQDSDYGIPGVSSWQRKLGIRNDEVADARYARLTSQARDEALMELEGLAQGGCPLCG